MNNQQINSKIKSLKKEYLDNELGGDLGDILHRFCEGANCPFYYKCSSMPGFDPVTASWYHGAECKNCAALDGVITWSVMKDFIDEDITAEEIRDDLFGDYIIKWG
jgi:hypothetical protein